MKKKTVYILFLLTISCLNSFSQKKNNSSQLAFQYFRSNEFNKAAILYNELYSKTKNRNYLNYLIKSYKEIGEYKKAENILKQEIKIHKKDPNLIILLGTVYKASGQKDKAEKLYQKAINKLDNKRHSIITLANAFISKQEYKYAEDIYLKKQKKGDPTYNFKYELANVYYYWRRYEKMIDAFLNVIEDKDHYLKTIQSRLQYIVYNQDDGSFNTQLKQKLISRIQKTGNSTYNELLAWLYIQEKNFGKAFIQTKALDKRKQENGKRLVELGKIAYKNKDIENAIRSFKYVKDLGQNNPYYIEARVGYISSLQYLVIKKQNGNNEHIENLTNEYKSFLAQNIPINQKTEVSIDFSHLLCFIKHQPEKGLKLIEDIIETPRIKSSTLSRAKIEYADQLLYTGQIWNATLFYSQVIKSNPNNEVGNEAQLKKAKLAFYSGDFLWAKGQLDVLKASTSKLISNDAFYLSSLISDNLETDSLSKPLELYAHADLLLYRNLTDSAITLLDSIAEAYPYHAISDDILFKKAQILASIKPNSAISLYQTFITKYYESILADEALMNLANLYWKNDQKEKASELYTKLLVDFPDSFLCTEARKKIVEFRDS